MAKTPKPVEARLHPDAIPDPEKTAAAILALPADPVTAGRRVLEAYRADPSVKHAPALAGALEAVLQQADMWRRYAMAARTG